MEQAPSQEAGSRLGCHEVSAFYGKLFTNVATRRFPEPFESNSPESFFLVSSVYLCSVVASVLLVPHFSSKVLCSF